MYSALERASSGIEAGQPEMCSFLPMVKNEVHSEFVRSLEISVIFRTNLQEVQIKIPFIVLTDDYMNRAWVTMTGAGL